jgi:hypothetical protein
MRRRRHPPAHPTFARYGVWLDEYEALGMAHTLERTWTDAVCYFGEGKEVGQGGRQRGTLGGLRPQLSLMAGCHQRILPDSLECRSMGLGPSWQCL